jgi:hypothetical protein
MLPVVYGQGSCALLIPLSDKRQITSSFPFPKKSKINGEKQDDDDDDSDDDGDDGDDDDGISSTKALNLVKQGQA